MPITICGRRTAVVAALACTAILSIACGSTEQYQMAQRVDMGPYTFEVAGAKTGFTRAAPRNPTIEVLFRLHRDDTAPFTTDFADSFKRRMQLVDAAGNTFVVFPVPNTQEYQIGGVGDATPIRGYWAPSAEVHRGGRRRADTYRASVDLSPAYMTGMGNIGHRENVGKTVSDFKLIIDNPDRGGDQPSRVVIQLH
jgi:hypothetical protein